MEYKLSRAGHVFNALKSTPNPKEHGFPFLLVKQASAFPPRANLSGKVGPTKDQMTTGACTAHASASMGERLYRRWKNLEPIFDPLFTYYMERQIEGTLAQGDCGAQVVTSLIAADCNPNGGGFGWAPQVAPFDPANVNVAPTPEQIAAARNNPGGAYHNIGNIIANIKSCILSDYSGVKGISVYDSFESDATATSGLVPYPNVSVENLLGGHELHSFLAYDDAIQCPNSPNPGAVLFQNSWGKWGIQCPFPSMSTDFGFAWISYDYLMNAVLASDIRMGHLGTAW